MQESKHTDDQVLWAALKEGNEHALGGIFDKYVYVLYHYGIKINNDDALVEDCIQDIFLELWQRRASLSNTSSVKYYLFTCLRRRILRKLCQYRPMTTLAEEDLAPTFSYETQLLEQQTSEENQEKLKQVLELLSEKQRKVIFLKFYDKLSYEEIADIMSLSVKAVYDLVYHSIKAMKKHFQKACLFLSVISLYTNFC